MASAYSNSGAVRAVMVATIIAGTLDILASFTFAVMAGGSPLGVLRGIAGAIVDPELYRLYRVPAAIGLGLHFAIMTAMAGTYMLIASRLWMLNRLPVLGGVGYGVMLWIIMFWFVLPRRWPTLFPSADPTDIAMQLGSHIMFVGLPIAIIASRARRWR